MAFGASAWAQTSITIEGWGPQGWTTATGSQHLVGTQRGRIHLDAVEGSWALLGVSVSIDPLLASQDPAAYASLIAEFPRLLPTDETVGSALGAGGGAISLAPLVDAGDLASAGTVPLKVWPDYIHQLVALCVNLNEPDPDAVKSYAQTSLTGSAFTWKSQYSTWAGTASEQYWLSTYAHPIGGVQGTEEFLDIHWFRLMESALISAMGLQRTIAFTRGDWMDMAASQFGLRLTLQAVTLRSDAAAPGPPEPSGPELVPGLEGLSGTELPRFTVSLPITIAIPYTDPKGDGLLTAAIPYYPGILNLNAPPGEVMFAAVGHTTSATHAIFPTESGSADSLLYRGPGGEGPIAAFVVPPGVVHGDISFVDLVGVEESLKRPLLPVEYKPALE